MSHWTSRVRGETETKRERYAEALYREFLALSRDDPAADVLICGDFNDEPDDPSLRSGLHAVTDPALVREGAAEPNLLDLVAGRNAATDGTYFYSGRWQFLDHLVASPGLLDPKGWRVLPETLATAHPPELRAGRSGAPKRFGKPASENPRGPSDHFALTVRIQVEPSSGR